MVGNDTQRIVVIVRGLKAREYYRCINEKSIFAQNYIVVTK